MNTPVTLSPSASSDNLAQSDPLTETAFDTSTGELVEVITHEVNSPETSETTKSEKESQTSSEPLRRDKGPSRIAKIGSGVSKIGSSIIKGIANAITPRGQNKFFENPNIGLINGRKDSGYRITDVAKEENDETANTDEAGEETGSTFGKTEQNVIDQLVNDICNCILGTRETQLVHNLDEQTLVYPQIPIVKQKIKTDTEENETSTDGIENDDENESVVEAKELPQYRMRDKAEIDAYTGPAIFVDHDAEGNFIFKEIYFQDGEEVESKDFTFKLEKTNDEGTPVTVNDKKTFTPVTYQIKRILPERVSSLNATINRIATGDALFSFIGRSEEARSGVSGYLLTGIRALNHATAILPRTLVSTVGNFTGDYDEAIALIKEGYSNKNKRSLATRGIVILTGVGSLAINTTAKASALALRVTLVTISIISLPAAIAAGVIVFGPSLSAIAGAATGTIATYFAANYTIMAILAALGLGGAAVTAGVGLMKKPVKRVVEESKKQSSIAAQIKENKMILAELKEEREEALDLGEDLSEYDALIKKHRAAKVNADREYYSKAIDHLTKQIEALNESEGNEGKIQELQTRIALKKALLNKALNVGLNNVEEVSDDISGTEAGKFEEIALDDDDINN